jgi:hypothetical protein
MRPNRKTSRQKATVIITSASIEATCVETSMLADLDHALNVASPRADVARAMTPFRATGDLVGLAVPVDEKLSRVDPKGSTNYAWIQAWNRVGMADGGL